MTLQRRALLACSATIAAIAASTLAGARNGGARSVAFIPADELSAEERARHERYMSLALDLLEAKRPPAPFAAVIVDRHTGEVVCDGVNRTRQSPTFHGEIVAINAGGRVRPKVEWRDLALYTTAEPCPMCMSAIVWAGIPELVYGTSVDELIRLGVNQLHLDSPTVAASAPFYSGRIIGGVLRKRTDPVYRRWAASLR
jgi:tRNA(adenine34) deaminase